RHQQSLLVRKLAFRAAVEKVRYVRVLLGFGQTKVSHAQAGKHLGQNIARWFRRKSDRQRISLVVHGETHKVRVRSIRRGKRVEAGHRDRAGDLPRAVSAKVEEDD